MKAPPPLRGRHGSPRAVWAAAEAQARRRGLEDRLAGHIEAMARLHGLARPEREYRFDSERRWRVDFAWPTERLAVEVEGLTFIGSGGRHQQAVGYSRDAEKYNALQLAGWQVLRFTRDHIRSGYAITAIRVALERAQLPR